ncbi:MAG: crossover junction endodeoxyribonuclease RuvC [Patescibacteria group bacterium]
MKVIGIDPGYDRLGVAVLESGSGGNEQLLYSTCLETPKEHDLPDRLAQLGSEFSQLLKEHQPDAIAIETLFFNKNQKTAIGVAQARGMIIYLGKMANCAVYEFGPQEIKIAVTGYGKSDKGAVIDMVKRLVSDAPETALDDEYDAIAVGITALAHHGRGR